MNRRKFLRSLLGVAALTAAGPSVLSAQMVTPPLFSRWKEVSFTLTDLELAPYDVNFTMTIQSLAAEVDRRCLELYLTR